MSVFRLDPLESTRTNTPTWLLQEFINLVVCVSPASKTRITQKKVLVDV